LSIWNFSPKGVHLLGFEVRATQSCPIYLGKKWPPTSPPKVDVLPWGNQYRSWISVLHEAAPRGHVFPTRGRLSHSSAPSWETLMINHLPREDMGSHGRTTRQHFLATIVTHFQTALFRRERNETEILHETLRSSPLPFERHGKWCKICSNKSGAAHGNTASDRASGMLVNARGLTCSY
jgi:hypothetical protein